ncbi:MAG TPA: hypothetical protein VKU60_00900 [Chloroflexota bacterium]|nr:hypothetical protein [Chloroflexota bacterium]
MALILSRSDVERVLIEFDGAVLEDLIRRVELGYREMAAGLVRQHSRIYLRYPDEGTRRPPGLFSMSALLPQAGVMGTRLLALGGGGGDGLLILCIGLEPAEREARCRHAERWLPATALRAVGRRRHEHIIRAD